MSMNPREVAYLAALGAAKGEVFVADALDQWRAAEQPSSLDFAFAQEIASGSVRMARALDYLGEKLAERQTLSLKLKEKVLLRTALYQHFFLDRVPLYAIVDETLKIAKQHCHAHFCGFLNALLRQLETKRPVLPKGKDPQALSIRYSYPIEFVRKVIAMQAEEVLEAQNAPPRLMVRVRNRSHLPSYLQILPGSEENVAVVVGEVPMAQLGSSTEIYIQNVTPTVLVAELAKRTPVPRTIIDLCASPGGKLLAAHDAFPQAKLLANDVSDAKLSRLTENLKKYGVLATFHCGKGEAFPLENKGDLIILDVPCSNSGVLNKRPEARWRLESTVLQGLFQTQQKLLERAALLLSKEGVIWYMTCSILQEENERVVEQFCKDHHFSVVYSRTILPNFEGWDGGFCALMRRV